MPNTNLAEILIFDPEKQEGLAKELSGLWGEDKWPDTEIGTFLKISTKETFTYKFRSGYAPVDLELKYGLKSIFMAGELLPQQRLAGSLSIICRFVESLPIIESLVDKSLAGWLVRFRTFLVDEGYSPAKKDGTKHESINLFSRIYKKVYDYYDPRSLFDRPVIDLNQVCTKGSKALPLKIDMQRLKQSWLRDAFREYIRFRSNKTASGTLATHFKFVRKFSAFLAENYPGLKPSALDRDVLVTYLDNVMLSVKSESISGGYAVNTISTLKTFLDYSARNEILMLETSGCIYLADIPDRPDPEPRYIPEPIVQNMIQVLSKLPAPWSLVLVLLLESGGRANEILSLPLNCLKKDADGDYWLKRFLSKQSKWHSVPIAPEIVALITELKAIVQENYGEHTKYLFPNPTGAKHLTIDGLSSAVNKWLKEQGIVDEDGSQWKFQSHSCRHTVGTRMLEQGLAHHFISDFLGHDSAEMTRIYATIKETTARGVANKVHDDRRVKRGGKEIDDYRIQAFKMAKKVRKNVIMQRVANGYCTLSVHSASCVSAVACLECIDDHFETTPIFLPKFLSERDEEMDFLNEAKEQGHQRQIEVSENKIALLSAVIDRLVEVGK